MSRIGDGSASRILRAEMARRGLTYADLIEALAKSGVKETNGGLRNKLSRGSFTADFFLQSLAAMKVTSLRLDES